MNCSKARFLVYAYLDREIPRQDAEALQRHLASCGSCAARGQSARRMGKLLRTRLAYARAPIDFRERLHMRLTAPIRPSYAPLGIAASILLLILPLVSDQRGPRSAALSLAAVTIGSPGARIVPVSRQMTGTFVCLQCEAGHADAACPLKEEPVHELGFCADNGERWRLMTTDREFASASVGQTVTVEGVAFPESGFLRASRVGY
ncbi:MAG: zf-HC2 domain-containing protein [Thermoanaerobaculia bacterium]